ncbi:unnamed protein product [Allacma fusca]|uniref:Uncharacterized protein n=1 Tax=Allacma fusca TaxID=39272 RepID=A0A8J2KUA7_9HEXA|nr:unnamed protein product [Allacma fusca]
MDCAMQVERRDNLGVMQLLQAKIIHTDKLVRDWNEALQENFDRVLGLDLNYLAEIEKTLREWKFRIEVANSFEIRERQEVMTGVSTHGETHSGNTPVVSLTPVQTTEGGQEKIEAKPKVEDIHFPPPACSITSSDDDDKQHQKPAESLETNQHKGTKRQKDVVLEEKQKKELDDQLDYWKHREVTVAKDDSLPPRKRVSNIPPPELTEQSHLPQPVEGRKERITYGMVRQVSELPISRQYIPVIPETGHQREDAIRKITVQLYGSHEAFGPIKGIDNVRETFLREELQLQLTWSRFTKKETPIRGVTIHGCKIDIVSACVVINDWLQLTGRISEWRGKDYDNLQKMRKRIPGFQIQPDVTKVLWYDPKHIVGVKKQYCMYCWKENHKKCPYQGKVQGEINPYS